MKNPIDSRQLRAFISLAYNENFTVAAKDLHLTQSAVSHSMKALEQDLGCRLFDRVGKKALLTQAGEQLLLYGERIMTEMEGARDALTHLSNWGNVRLRLGASTTACEYLIPRVMREFKRDHPNCIVTIVPGDSPQALEALTKNRIDLALVIEPRREPQLDFQPLFTDELRFLVAPTHQWAQQGKVTKDQISEQNYILYNKTSYTFQMVEGYFKRENISLNSVIQFGSMEAIKELVKQELGVGILAPWVAQKEIEEGSLVTFPLGSRKLKRTWGITHWKERRLSLPEERFISLCKSAAAKLYSS